MTVDVEGDLRQALVKVKLLMAEAFNQVGGTPMPGTALDQCGLRDGDEVIEDYLRHGEAGVAFEHLLYMILEPRLPISMETYELIDRVGRALGMEPSKWKESQPSAEARI